MCVKIRYVTSTSIRVKIIQGAQNLRDKKEDAEISTESSKYYARIQTAVARGLGLPAGWLVGHQTDTASEHSLCYFSLFSE